MYLTLSRLKNEQFFHSKLLVAQRLSERKMTIFAFILNLIIMNNITYLFGAGASVGALPIVNQIPNRIENLIALMESRVERIVVDLL